MKPCDGLFHFSTQVISTLWCGAALRFRLVDVMYFAADKRSFHDGLWAVAIPIPWVYGDPTLRSTAFSCKLSFDCRLFVLQSPPMFLGWQNCKVLAVSLARRLEVYLPTSECCSEGYEPFCAFAVPAAPSFAYNSCLLMSCASDYYN